MAPRAARPIHHHQRRHHIYTAIVSIIDAFDFERILN